MRTTLFRQGRPAAVVAALVGLIALAATSQRPVLAQKGEERGMDGAARITQAQFKKLIAARTVIIVDTRNADAFAQGHIPGAQLLPLEGRMTWPMEFEKFAESLEKTKKTVVTYCA
jgi:predicted sulfurtransferase